MAVHGAKGKKAKKGKGEQAMEDLSSEPGVAPGNGAEGASRQGAITAESEDGKARWDCPACGARLAADGGELAAGPKSYTCPKCGEEMRVAAAGADGEEHARGAQSAPPAAGAEAAPKKAAPKKAAPKKAAPKKATPKRITSLDMTGISTADLGSLLRVADAMTRVSKEEKADIEARLKAGGGRTFYVTGEKGSTAIVAVMMAASEYDALLSKARTRDGAAAE